MRLCLIGKYPPIEGGVSAQTYWTAHLLARTGHTVHVVTNADEVEPTHREWFLPGDIDRLEATYPGGGSVEVRYTQGRHDDDLYYIPRSSPTVTRLASVAAEVVRRHHCDVVVAWYLEPYVLAASLVASWTATPYLVRHAGSDLYDLAAQPELGPAYRECLRAAAGVLSSALPAEGVGLRAEQVFGFPGLSLPDEFGGAGPSLDLAATAGALRARGWGSALRTSPFPTGTVVVGSYGKLGESKGTLDLVRAVARVRAAGHAVGLALLGGGRGWPTVLETVAAAGLADATITVPMLAPWQVPAFIRACDAVAFLERDFEVPQHRPSPPLEVLACGRPLLVSRETVPLVLPGRNASDPVFTAVEAVDPHDPEQLAAGLLACFARPGVERAAALAGLPTGPQVAAWYADVVERVVAADAPVRPIRRGVPELAEVERLLQRHAPVLFATCGADLATRHSELVARAVGPLPAAYEVTAAGVIELAVDPRPAAADPDRATCHALALAEHHALWTLVDIDGLDGIPAFPVPVRRVPFLPTADDLDALGRLVPVASTWLRVVTFPVDAFAHLTDVRAGRRISEAPTAGATTSQTLLFHKAPNLVGTIARAGLAVRILLDAATGEPSLREIAARVSPDPSRLDGLLAVLTRLHRAGVIAFRRDPIG